MWCNTVHVYMHEAYTVYVYVCKNSLFYSHFYLYPLPQESLLDATRNYQHDLHNVKYIASCVPSALMGISPQLHSLFNLVPFFYPSDDCLQRIFSQSVLLWLQQFTETAVGDPMPVAEVGSTHSL